ncbi:hypothetical protein HanIR_Chr08g0390201 [Helianthus annuus]|nr:hypothetical protein HanIR_Chr08g0390201 [Helianthus annuus]
MSFESMNISQNKIFKYKLYVQSLYSSALSVFCTVSARYRFSLCKFSAIHHSRTVKSKHYKSLVGLTRALNAINYRLKCSLIA